MKTFITALISCSLMLGAIAMAQQDEEQQKGKKKKSQQTSEAQPQATAPARGEQHGKGMGKAGAAQKERTPTTGATGQANVNAPEGAGKHKGKRGEPTEATSPAATEDANVGATPEGGKHKGKRAEAAMKQASPSPAATGAVAGAAGTKPTKPGNIGKNGKQVNVQQIKGQHTNFHAQPQPQKVKPVTFNQNYRIVGAERWQGPQYEVFRTYQPGWHDSGWYRSNFSRVEMIGGGYYYFNNGYWYPAWGYDPSAQYYAYDGPIYAGQRAEPPDQVIADVQSALQQMGYYRGEVDGLLGPMTREALTAYQSDHGLYATAVIDEPTLDALGMS